MKISIDKSALTQALDIVSKASPKKSVMQILDGVMLIAENGRVCFYRNNLDIAIKYTIDCEIRQQGSTVANASIFSSVAKRMPDEEIDISLKDNRMEIEAGNARMEIAVLPPKGFPQMLKVGENFKFEIDSQVLKELVGGVVFATSDDDNRPVLQGICMSCTDGNLDVAAIDGFSMAWRRAKVDCGNFKIIPKGIDLDSVSKLFSKGMVTISASENLVGLEDESIKATIGVVEGEYYAYKTMLPAEFETKVKINTKAMQQIVDRAMLLVEISEKARIGVLKILINAKGMRFRMATGMGELDELYEVNVDGADLEIAYNPLYLSNALKHIEDKETFIKFTNWKGPAIFEPIEGNKYTYMILPVNK